MQTNIDRTSAGYRPIATQITEPEWNILLTRSPVAVNGIKFYFSHWQKGDRNRIYITTYYKGRRFSGSYIERYELPGYPEPETRIALRADPMSEQFAQAFIEAIR